MTSKPSKTHLSEEHTWLRFFKEICLAFYGALVGLFLVIAFINPYNNVFFMPGSGPSFGQGDRYAYPAYARQKEFDSAVFGRSTVRALRPPVLNQVFNARFVDLAIKASTAKEQYKIMDLFLRHHPHPKYLIIGIDSPWCTIDPKDPERWGDDDPVWLYDENPFNDLGYLLNVKVLEIALKGFFLHSLGMGPTNDVYDETAYNSSVPPQSEYAFWKVQQSLRASETIFKNVMLKPRPQKIPAFHFTQHHLLKEMLKRLPSQTQVIFMFPPYHVTLQAPPSSLDYFQMAACKKEIVQMARMRPQTHVVDFMFSSQITRNAQNYWDALHYTIPVADKIVQYLHDAITTKKSRPDLYHYVK